VKPTRLLAVLVLVITLAAGTVFAAADGQGPPDMTHRMMMLVIQLGVILLAARIGHALLERVRLPGVLGELTAGILIGPYLLGALPLPAFPDGLFPLGDAFPISPELYGLSSIAAVVLLFMVGLETDVRLFMRYSLAGSLVGVGGVVASFLLGDWMAVVFSRSLLGQPLSFLSPPCLFLGVISTATSVAITARILSEERKLDSPEGVTVLAGAVADDVLGIILLAVGLGIITASAASGGINWMHIGVIAVKAVGIWLVATVVGLLSARRISLLLKAIGDRSAIAMTALGFALILAGLFEEAGLATIIGAYVMGLSLSRADISHVIRERLHSVYAFLVPVFFAVMGMLVDVRLLASRQALVFGLIYTVGISLAKIFGCGVPALLTGFNWRGALRVGCGMLPRGEVTLIIAGIGLSAGVLTSEVFGVVVLMVLLTALIAPPALLGAFAGAASGLRRPRAGGAGQVLTFRFPSYSTADLVVRKLFEVFESEGFFVHVLDRVNQMHQLRKDEVVIGFRRENTNIVFQCDRSEVSLVNTAMVEVLAELEQTIRELKKPVDRAAIGRRLQQEAPAPTRTAVLSEYLSADLLVPRLRGEDKRAVIEELLEVLHRKGAVRDLADARKAIWDREQSMSTGMQHGIAIPHGRTDAVSRLACAVGVKPDGVDFASIDGEPSKIIVLTLSPRSGSSPHVQFMSMISQILNAEGRRWLLACETPEDMLAVLSGEPRLRPDARGLRRRAVRRFVRFHPRRRSGLAKYLRPDQIAPELEATTKEDAIETLLGLLADKGLVRDRDAARRDIFAREELIPTGLDHEVAIPHARTDAVSDLVCAVGRSRMGIDFGADDGKPSKIVVLTLSPKSAFAPHVHFMALMSRILDEEGRRDILKAGGRREIFRALAERWD